MKIIRQFPEWQSKDFNIMNWNSQFIESNIIINTHSRLAYFPKHWTPLSIKCAFGGAEYYETDKMRFRVDDSRFLLLNEGRHYESSIDSETRVNSFTICFTPQHADSANALMNSSDVSLLDLPENSNDTRSAVQFHEQLYGYDKLLMTILSRLRMITAQPELSQLEVNELLNLLMVRLLKLREISAHQISSVRKVRTSTKKEIFKRVTIARDYIDSNFQQKIELKDIARAACMNEFHLLREFSSAYHVTPHKYLTNRRLEESKRLLRSTDIPVSQVAIMVGFEFLSSFSKLFKNNYQISPARFRSAL